MRDPGFILFALLVIRLLLPLAILLTISSIVHHQGWITD